MQETKLYRKNAVGIGTWRIWVVGMTTETAVICYAHAVVANGAEVAHHDTITLNGSGRNIEQQTELEIASRVSRMRDKGYKNTVADAMLGSTNQLNLLNPMLAQSMSKVKVAFELAHVQPKFDGHRCLITNHEGNIVPYSRKGKLITTIPHICADFKWLPEGKTVDGELYIHGRPLQSISSLIKRQQVGSGSLRYHWYDYVSPRLYIDRLASMHKACTSFPMKHVEIAPTYEVRSLEHVSRLFTAFRNDGFEGAMLRLSIEGYQPNSRAAQLLKVKERKDMEVTVLGAKPSKDGWAVLRVRTPTGQEFDTSAPGDLAEKARILQTIDQYVGRKLTIEYAMLTEDGVPFHAVATRWHEEV